MHKTTVDNSSESDIVAYVFWIGFFVIFSILISFVIIASRRDGNPNGWMSSPSNTNDNVGVRVGTGGKLGMKLDDTLQLNTDGTLGITLF